VGHGAGRCGAGRQGRPPGPRRLGRAAYSNGLAVGTGGLTPPKLAIDSSTSPTTAMRMSSFRPVPRRDSFDGRDPNVPCSRRRLRFVIGRSCWSCRQDTRRVWQRPARELSVVVRGGTIVEAPGPAYTPRPCRNPLDSPARHHQNGATACCHRRGHRKLRSGRSMGSVGARRTAKRPNEGRDRVTRLSVARFRPPDTGRARVSPNAASTTFTAVRSPRPGMELLRSECRGSCRVLPRFRSPS